MSLLLIKFTLSQLIFSYAHIGFSKTKTYSYLLKKYLLGFYYFITIINLNYSIFFLKLVLNLVNNAVFNNNCILLFSEYFKLLTTNLIFFYKYFNIYYYFQTWIPGTLISLKFFNKMKFFKKFLNIRTKTPKFFLKSIPGLILSMSPFNLYVSTNIAKESNKLTIPLFSFIDSSFNPLFFTYFSLINLKSFKSIFFFFKLVNNFLLKIYLLKKIKFVNKVIKKIL